MAGETQAAAAHGAEASGGFPPFDASLFSHQIFWFWVAFALLYLVLAIVVIPRIGRTVEARRNAIQADLSAAAEAGEAARAARDAAAAKAQAAQAAARQRIESMRKANEAAAAGAEARSAASASARMADAEAAIATARSAAIAAIRDEAGALAADIVERVAGFKPAARSLNAAVKAVQGAA